jgi:polyisoprenoid-binding protein YceI
MSNNIIKFLIILFVVSLKLNYAQGIENEKNEKRIFNFDDPNKRNQVSFESKAPLEDIFGFTNEISGKLEVNLTDLKTLRGEFTAKASTLKTGIELRDQHLREEGWLDAGKYPEIKLKIKEITKVEKLADRKFRVFAKADFSLKGATKTIDVQSEVNYLPESQTTKSRFPGNLLTVRAEFKVKLSDFGIKQQIIGQKVAEEVLVKTNLVGSDKL